MRPRAFVVVSRQVLIDSRYSTVICAPISSSYDGLSTQVRVGIVEDLKHEGSTHCDELVSFPKAALTDFLGALSPGRIAQLLHTLLPALEQD